jgi:uncharacterized sulfatase
MMRGGIVIYSFLVLGYFSLSSCGSKPEKENLAQPNILFIMSDDHAYQAISAYGHPVSRLAPTPNIDRLADEGIRFDGAFCTNSICGPSRATILTGKFGHKNGYMSNGDRFDGRQQTFPKILREHGYQTAVIGKWHLLSVPTGFDYWKILDDQGAYYNPDFITLGDTTREEGYATDLITQSAIDWLEKRDKSRPFCVMMHHKAPHRNWMPALKNLNLYDSVQFPLPDNYFDDYEGRLAASQQKMNIYRDMYEGHDLRMTAEKGSDSLLYDRWPDHLQRMTDAQREMWFESYRRKNDAFHEEKLSGEEVAIWKYQRYLQDYMATVASLDESMGQILDYLKEAGLEENTLVVYTSDQGFYLGEHGWFDKRFMYEESLRMPLLMRLPEVIPAGLTSEAMVQNLDFAGTFLELAGIKIPADMQGTSLLPILKGNMQEDWRDAIYYHYYAYPGFHNIKRHYGVRSQRYKLIHFYYDIDAWEFYDLEKDPQEMHNLIDDPAQSDVIAEYKQKLQDLMDKYGEPPMKEWQDEDIYHGRKPVPQPEPPIQYPFDNRQ